MSTPQHVFNAAQNHWDRYRNNFSRHLIGVSRYMQTRMMNTLQQECGHEHLRLGRSIEQDRELLLGSIEAQRHVAPLELEDMHLALEDRGDAGGPDTNRSRSCA